MSTYEARFQDYLANLQARVNERCLELPNDPTSASATSFREVGFTECVLEILLDLGQIGDSEVVYLDRRFGRYVGKLNGWSVDEEDGRLDLVTTIFNGISGSNSIPGGELADAARKAVRVFLAASQPVHLEMEPASPAFDMMQGFHELNGTVRRIRVLILADGVAGDAGLYEGDPEAAEVKVEVWDLQRLFRAEASGAAYEAINIDIESRLGAPLPCLPAPGARVQHRCYLAVLPGELIYSMYHEFGPRLLELNVRSFLQARGKVNRGIRDTLKDEPAQFLAYNNGISATAEELDLIEIDGCRSAIRSITGLQIVNGGQTVASIHRAKDRDGLDLDNVFVQAKITLVSAEQIETLVPKISRFANTQNRVSEADFSANHPFHVKLQQLSETMWSPGEQNRWFYERARGQYQVARAREGTTPARRLRFDQATPARQHFDKVKLAKYVNVWDELPHVVSRGGQKNFVEFMLRLSRNQGSDWLPDADYYRHLIAKAIITMRAEKIARLHKLPAYRANAVAYTVSLVAYRTAGRVDLQDIWNRQDCSQALADTIYEWMPQVWNEITGSAGTRNVTEWCKKEECWRQIQILEVEVPNTLESELSSGQPLPNVGDASERLNLTAEDRENIARVMQVSAEEWIHLVGWGSRTSELKSWQIGIASTLATYAATGWSRVPSKKQARQGAAMLAVAEAQRAWPETA
ncbi:AIPR family protein [soil metagenome]